MSYIYDIERMAEQYRAWLISWGIIGYDSTKPPHVICGMYNKEIKHRDENCKQIIMMEEALGCKIDKYPYLHDNVTDDGRYHLYSNSFLLSYKNYLKRIIKQKIAEVSPHNPLVSKKKMISTKELIEALKKLNIDLSSLVVIPIEDYNPAYENRDYKPIDSSSLVEEEPPLNHYMNSKGKYIEEIPPDRLEDMPQDTIEVYIPKDKFLEYIEILKKSIKEKRIKLSDKEKKELNLYIEASKSEDPCLMSIQFEFFIILYNNKMSECFENFKNSEYYIDINSFSTPVSSKKYGMRF